MQDLLVREALVKYKSSVSILKKGYEQEKFRIEQICRSPLGSLVVRNATSVDIASFRDDRLSQVNQKTKKPIAASTVRLELSLLSSFFDICRIEWGLCESNPVTNVRKPKAPPGRDRRLTPREDRQILRYAHSHSNQEFYSIVILALETAMRQSEIIKLCWEHLDLKSRIAHLPDTKNGSKRDVPLSAKARDALIRLGVKSKGNVFTYTSSGIKSTWRFMLGKLGIEDLHFHDMRHEAISRFFELGSLDMMEIAAISGHKSLSMLKRYTHLKAHKLVRKLDGNKHKGKQVIIDHLIPYPAQILRHEDQVTLKILDFEGIVLTGTSSSVIIRAAQDVLLRHLMTLIKESKRIPPPDQYLELVDESQLVMIDPMGGGEWVTHH
ncbi:site-specific integrase [Methylovorus glucosotrophus]|uniref:Integrase family protein n=1 Tax=Methylovorus glucosotrophus (strain SIP3-4) TaxID=582744 RepID=C6XEL1_METGS|nr:site-specific integrase [Methylovorus glucosotrophus]ACT52068.1 integrase family protein [Methylovorus glucosotrophus SIP3-4]